MDTTLNDALINEFTCNKLVESFQHIPDPRVTGRSSHKLMDVLVISILAVISGSSTWNEIEDYGKAKQAWLAEFLSLEQGIPSHDTFNRVFQILKPEVFEHAFREWIIACFDKGDGNIIAIDGKSLRGSKDGKLGKKAIHMVSAFASEQNLILAQVATEEKSNELTAIPKLIDSMDIEDCMITIDAMGCQTAIAEKIVAAGGDYFLAVKNNQKKLYESLVWLFGYADSEGDLAEACETFDAKHGRFETRRCWVMPYDGFLDKVQWEGLVYIVKVQRESVNVVTGKKSKETRYYITSDAECTPEKALHISRSHWGIENNLHWMLDVTFKEDHSRARKANAAHNFGILRRMALTLLEKADAPRMSIQRRRYRASMDNDFALKVLNAI